MQVDFDGKDVTVAGKSWTVEHPVDDAKVIDGKVVLLLSRMSAPHWRQFQNLRAYDFDGNELWIAEHPSNETADCYTYFMSERDLADWNTSFAGEDRLVVYNFNAFICRINPENGKLLEAVFTK